MKRYEQVLKDLDSCANAETCTECSVKGSEKGEPDCFRAVMRQAARAIREQERVHEIMTKRYYDTREDLTQARVSGINGIRAVLELIGAVEAER